MAYLGYINVGYAVLAGIGLWNLKSVTTLRKYPDLDIVALTVLGIANASQAWGNFMLSRRSGRWIMGMGWDRITVLDMLFAALDGAVLVSHVFQD